MVPNSYGRTDYHDDVRVDSYGQPAAPLDFELYPPWLEIGFQSKEDWEIAGCPLPFPCWDYTDPLENCQLTEEHRFDHFSKKWHTKQGFYDHYGDYIMWDMLSPKKVSQRFMLETILKRNYEEPFLPLSENVNYIVDKMIQTFM